MSRFDYIQWDAHSAHVCQKLKLRFQWLEQQILESLEDSREKSLALTKLEESFMWIGKAIRNDQLKREATDGTLPLPDQPA